MEIAPEEGALEEADFTDSAIDGRGHSNSSSAGHTLEDTAVLTREDLAAFGRLCARLRELTESLRTEDATLKGASFGKHERLRGLKGALGVTEAVCGECARSLATLTSQLGDLRKGLTCVASTLEEKLAAEGVGCWMPPPQSPASGHAKRAEQKALLAQAAQARSIAGSARTEVSVLLEKAATLEAEAAQASADSMQASEEAEAASRRAEESQKAAELKAQSEAEELQKAEERRKREEEQRKRREEEQERQRRLMSHGNSLPDEERMKAEEARLDPNNWPMSVYSVEAGDLDLPIGCVVRSLPGSFNRVDLEVETMAQLDDVLPLIENEELVSHIINLIPTSGNSYFKMEAPLAVALPHVAPRHLARETVIKKRLPNGQWAEIDTYDVTIEHIKEFKFVEVRLRQMAPLAVVTRMRKETLTLTRKGGKLSPSVDARISINARPASVRVPTSFTFEVHPVELTAVSDLKMRNPDVTGRLLSSSPIVSLLAPIRSFVKPVVVSLPVPPPPHKAKPRPSTAQPPSGGVPGKSATSGKDSYSRHQPRPASTFFGFAIKKEEDLEDMLHLITWDANAQAWNKVPDVTFTQTKNKDAAAFECQDYSLIKRFLILRTKVGATDAEVEKLAVRLEVSLRQRTVQMILRQYCNDPQEVTLHCVPLQKSERFQKKLAEDGFVVGPAPSRVLTVHEGQKMEVRFRGNIKDVNDSRLQFVFNSHMKTKLNFPIVEIDRYAQKGIDCYRGFVQVFTRGMVEKEVPREDSKKEAVTELVEGPVLLTEMLISLPKPEPEPPKPLEKAAVIIKGGGIINEQLLRHLAGEIGDEWRRLARHLNLRRMRIQAIMRNNVNRDQENAVYDMLLTWAKQVPHSCNKVEMLCHALGSVGRVDLVEEMRDLEQDFREQRAQLLRDSVLKKAFVKVAQNAHVISDWKYLARQLGLPEADIRDIEEARAGLRERCLQSLVRWRELQGAGATTEALLKYLRRCKYHQVIGELNLIVVVNDYHPAEVRLRRDGAARGGRGRGRGRGLRAGRGWYSQRRVDYGYFTVENSATSRGFHVAGGDPAPVI